jgi:putative ABC transport system substrate-binding protein
VDRDREKDMKKKLMVLTLCAMLFALCSSGEAQQPTIYRIGFLRGAPPLESHFELFRQTLKELGYIEGKNITLEYRWAGGAIGSIVGSIGSGITHTPLTTIFSNPGSSLRSN